MNTLVHQRKATMFRLDIELLERLKELAKKEHRSLNNFVECMLLDIAYNKPNKETIEAINNTVKQKLAISSQLYLEGYFTKRPFLYPNE